MKKIGLSKKKEKLIIQLKSDLEAIIWQAHQPTGHIPYYQHRKFNDIIWAVIHKIQEYQDDMLINYLENHFMKMQDPIYDNLSFPWRAESTKEGQAARRIRHMCGAVNVALMIHSKKKGYGIKR